MHPDPSGTVYLFCFKTGVLSRVAHDIRLSVQPREFSRIGDAIRAVFSPTDIVVDGAIKGQHLSPKTLSNKDKHDIRKKLRAEVLKGQNFPTITVCGDLNEGLFQGELTLMGLTRPLRFPTTIEGDVILAEFEIQPSRWGIRPYRALLGAIQLQYRIRVECRFPVP